MGAGRPGHSSQFIQECTVGSCEHRRELGWWGWSPRRGEEMECSRQTPAVVETFFSGLHGTTFGQWINSGSHNTGYIHRLNILF